MSLIARAKAQLSAMLPIDDEGIVTGWKLILWIALMLLGQGVVYLALLRIGW
jgi:hypothetical protein